jgi:hypothetical protein
MFEESAAGRDHGIDFGCGAGVDADCAVETILWVVNIAKTKTNSLLDQSELQEFGAL